MSVVQSSLDYEEYPCPTRLSNVTATLTSSENRAILIKKLTAILKLSGEYGTRRPVSASLWLSVSEMDHICRILGLVVYLWEYWPKRKAYIMPRMLSPAEYE